MNLLVSRSSHQENTVIKIGNLTIGDGSLTIIAGPCTIETEDQLMETAIGICKAGANILRGGAYKPRTSPYSYQGMGLSGLQLLSKAKRLTGLPTVSEIIDPRDIEHFEDVDILQVGAKNMQNYSLLKELGKTQKPILLKRGWSNTLEEFLQSAEYILNEGNDQVILCERGIRTFEPLTRNSFDINAIPLLKELSHLPVIGDPSHGTGKTSLVAPVSMAITVAGADGIMVEVHDHPEDAKCDGLQAVNVAEFGKIGEKVRFYEKVRYIDGKAL